MYQFDNSFDRTHFFWFDKRLIEAGNWAMLPSSSQAVFPVIADHCNEKGHAHPSAERIGILAGLSDTTTRQGIRGLLDFPGFSFENYTTKRGRPSKKFHLKLLQNPNAGTAFPFYRFVLQSGCWRVASPSAKALYVVMRFFGYFDLEQYAELENLEMDDTPFADVFRERPYDFCEATSSILTELSGLKRRSFFNAIKNLEASSLVEPIGGGRFKVFLRTKPWPGGDASRLTIITRRDLNVAVRKAYAHRL